MFSVYFVKEVMSLTSSCWKFQTLVLSVAILFFLMVVAFALLVTESFLKTVLVTYKKLHVHGYFPEIKYFTFSGLSVSLYKRFHGKKVILLTMSVQGNRAHTIHVVSVYAQGYLHPSRKKQRNFLCLCCCRVIELTLFS